MIKKYLSLIIAVMFTLTFLFSSMVFAASVKTADAKGGTAKIDGTIEKAWDKAKKITVNTYIDKKKGATGTARAMWDKNYLYVLFEVKDAKLGNANANAWEKDSIEIFLDEKNEKAAKYDANDGQYRVNYKNETSGGGSYKKETFKTAAKVVKGGYVVEAAIPWVALKGKAAVNKVVGFDLQINDDMGAGKRESVTVWNEIKGDAYANAGSFGNLKLVK